MSADSSGRSTAQEREQTSVGVSDGTTDARPDRWEDLVVWDADRSSWMLPFTFESQPSLLDNDT